MPDVGAGEERSQQTQCGRVGPLQVVQKNDERMVPARQCREQVLEYELKSVLRLDRSQRGRRCLLAQDQRNLGDHLGHHAAAGAAESF